MELRYNTKKRNLLIFLGFCSLFFLALAGISSVNINDSSNINIYFLIPLLIVIVFSCLAGVYNKKSMLGSAFLVILPASILFMVLFTTLSIASPRQPDNRTIGYEFLDDGEVLHIWNEIDDYYFNWSSGVQFSNHYQEYWTHNIFCFGFVLGADFVLGANWNDYCVDELDIDWSIDTDNETYINVSGSFEAQLTGRRLNFTLTYGLENNDTEIGITGHVKNTGNQDIGEWHFIWKTQNIQIRNDTMNDKIRLWNSTGEMEEYLLNQTLDKTYINLSNGTYYLLDDEYAYLIWNKSLNYALQVKNESGQYNAPVTLTINFESLASGEENSTKVYWKDAGDTVTDDLNLPCDPAPGFYCTPAPTEEEKMETVSIIYTFIALTPDPGDEEVDIWLEFCDGGDIGVQCGMVAPTNLSNSSADCGDPAGWYYNDTIRPACAVSNLAHSCVWIENGNYISWIGDQTGSDMIFVDFYISPCLGSGSGIYDPTDIYSVGDSRDAEITFDEWIDNWDIDNAPTSTLNLPENNNVTSDNYVNFTCNATDDYQLSNITFYWNYTGTWEADGTVSFSPGAVSAIANFSREALDNVGIIWNCLAEDNESNTAFAPTNWTVTINMTTDYNFTYLINETNTTVYGYLNGTLNNTFFNSLNNAIKLGSTYNNGTYLSQIFDVNSTMAWNNISWTQEGPYQRELPDNQAVDQAVETRYINGNANMTANILLYHMNEKGTGGGPNGYDIEDFSGEENHGNWSGGAAFGVSGKFGTAINFDGYDDYINTTLLMDISRNLTYEAWIKIDSMPQNYGHVVGSNDGNDGNRVSLQFNSTHIQWFYEKPNGDNQIAFYNLTDTNNWHHVVGTAEENDTIRLYVDGVQVDSLASVTSPSKTDSPITIGRNIEVDILEHVGFSAFNGSIDEVAMYNRTLSADEILDHYKRGALKLNLTVRSCDDEDCSGESFTDVTDNSSQNLFIPNNRYFQYRFAFETENETYSPELYNVTIDYAAVQDHNFTYLINETDTTVDSFLNGTLNNTLINNSNKAMRLAATIKEGNYLSQIFDVGSDTSWDNISWVQGGPYQKELPDNQAVETGWLSGNANMTENVLLININETSGTIIDYSGKGNDGTQSGGVGYGASGKFGTAISFDGDDNYIQINHDSSLTPNNITVGAWIYLIGQTEEQTIIDKRKSTGGGYNLRVSGTAYPLDAIFVLRNANNVEYFAPARKVVTANNWHFFVGTYNGTHQISYFNGIEKSVNVESINGINKSDQVVRIGDVSVLSAPSVYNFNGSIDEVFIFNRTLSPQEVMDLYKRGALRLNLTARSCDDANCDIESFTDVTGSSPQDLSVLDNRYFQYNFEFKTYDSSYSPELYNVTINYESIQDYNFTYLINETITTIYGYLNGTLNNTFFNNSNNAIKLDSTYNNGTYLSQIFDVNSIMGWNNISWVEEGTETPWLTGADMTKNVLLFHFDSVNATNYTLDSSGKNNHGQLRNYSCDPASCNLTTGRLGNALIFDGDDDYVWVDSSERLNITNNITVEAWVKPTDDGSQTAIASDMGAGGNLTGEYSWMLGFGVTSSIENFDISPNGSARYYATGEGIENNTWQHIAGTFNGSVVKVYRNGIETGSANYSGTILGNSKHVLIGSRADGVDRLRFKGTIDEVAIYNRSLSAQEILDHYNMGVWRLNLTVRSCDDASCDVESFTDVTDSSPQDLSVVSNRYFQYNFEFKAYDSSYSPELYNVTIGYKLTNCVVINGGRLVNSICENSTIDGCYVENSIINSSTLTNASGYKYDCRVLDSTIDKVNLTSSYAANSTIDPTTVIDSLIINSTTPNATISYSTLENTTLCSGMDIFGASIIYNSLVSGRIIYSNNYYYAPANITQICANITPQPVGTLEAIPSTAKDNTSLIIKYHGQGVGYNVTLNTSPLNSANTTITLTDDGISPDETVDDAIYTGSFTINMTGDENKTLVATITALGNIFYANTTVVLDNTEPNATIQIFSLDGNTTVTNYRTVTLNLSYIDLNGIKECRYSNDNFSSNEQWEGCATTKAWLLTQSYGNKTVYYQVKDNANNIKDAEATISYEPGAGDSTPPTQPTVYDGLEVDDIDFSNANTTLSAHWFNSTDYESTVLYRYKLYENNSCIAGYCNWIDTGTEIEVTVTGLTLLEGNNYTFEVMAYNTAGLNSTTAFSDGVIIDYTAPQVTLLNSSTHPDNTTYYSSTDPQFNWTATDQSGIKGYSYIIDQTLTTVPDSIIDTTAKSVNYSGISDGTWYFHIKVQDNATNWGNTSTFMININTTGVAIRINSPTDNQIFYTTTINVSGYVSENALLDLYAQHADGSNYTDSQTTSGNFTFTNVQIENNTNVIYVNATANNLTTKSNIVHAVLKLTNLTFTITYNIAGSSRTTHIVEKTYADYTLGIASESSSTTTATASPMSVIAGTDKPSYIFMTRPGADLTTREESLGIQQFLDLISPSFGYPLDVDKDNTISIILHYPNIYITGNQKRQEGKHELVIRNKGRTDDNKKNITIVIR